MIPFQCPVCSSMEKKNLLKREEARQQFLATGVWPKYFHSKSSASAVSQASSSKVSKVSKVSKQRIISLDTSKKPVVTPKVVHTPKDTPKVLLPNLLHHLLLILGLEASLPSDTSTLSESSGRVRKRVLVIPKKKVACPSKPVSTEVPLQLFEDIVQEVVPEVPNVSSYTPDKDVVCLGLDTSQFSDASEAASEAEETEVP